MTVKRSMMGPCGVLLLAVMFAVACCVALLARTGIPLPCVVGS